jgi:hypothetical protein
MARAIVAGRLKVGIIPPPASAGRDRCIVPRPTAPPGPRAAAARAWRRGEGARRARGPRTRRAGGAMISLERHVPEKHLLRAIDRFVELDGVRAHLAPFYSATGRPSIDPELLIRMLIVGYCFGIRPERRLCEEVHLNLAYCWFCSPTPCNCAWSNSPPASSSSKPRSRSTCRRASPSRRSSPHSSTACRILGPHLTGSESAKCASCRPRQR